MSPPHSHTDSSDNDNGSGSVPNPLLTHSPTAHVQAPLPAVDGNSPGCTFPKLLELNDLTDDKASEYDLCMVFKAVKSTTDTSSMTLDKRGKVIVQKLLDNGLDIFLVYSLRQQHIFVLIRASLQKLRLVAEEHQVKMLLDEQKLKAVLEAGNPEKNIAPLEIPHDPSETEFRPHEYIAGRFRTEVDSDLYWRPDDISHPFRESVRLKLTLIMIELPPPCGGDCIQVRKQVEKGNIAAFFPLHNLKRKQELSDSVMQIKNLPWDFPLFRMKEYFGEKIGLYFTFMGHFSKWLLLPAVVGLPLQIYIIAIDNYTINAQIGFAIFIVLWAIVMLEFWKRKEKLTAMKWGMIDFEKNEVTRPEFRGGLTKSLIDGKEILFFSDKERQPLIYQSMLIIGSMIALVIGVVISIYIIRNALAKSIGSDAQLVASLANSIQIQVFNFLYSKLADYLTERENHRTDTEFEDSMIAKTFLFQFVNSYASFFYIAFIAKYQPRPAYVDDESEVDGDCGSKSCMRPLAANLAVIFFTRVVIGNLTELLLPLLQNRFEYNRESKLCQGQSFIRVEEEFMLSKYNIMKATISDYAEVVINFGYIVLFATALPAVGLIGFVANWLEMTGDAWKLLHVFQRPVPRGAEDIGQWQDILMIVAIIGCMTNAGLTVFTMSVFDDYSDMFRMWFFLLFQWFCFLTQSAIMAAVPDDPVETTIQTSRADIMTEKAVRLIPDDVLGGGDNDDDAQVDSGALTFTTYSYLWSDDNVKADYTSEDVIGEDNTDKKFH